MKKTALFCVITGYFFILNPCLFAQDVEKTEVLTWEQCVQEALRNNPDLISSAEQVTQAQADKDIVKSDLLPQVDATLSATKAKSATADKSSDTYTSGISARQLIFDGWKTPRKVEQASRTMEAQEYDSAVASSDIRLSLRTAFISLLKNEQLIALTEQIAQRRQQNRELVQLRYQAGREHKGSLLTAVADLANAEFEVEQAYRAFRLAQRQLSAALGSETMRELRVEGAFLTQDEYPDAMPDFDELADTTPFLRELISRKEAARLNLLGEKSDYYPQVYLSGDIDRTNKRWPPSSDNEGWSAGFTVSLPLFEGGSRKAEVTKARSQLTQAEADERSGRDTVLVTLEQTWKDLRDSVSFLGVQEKFLEATRERARIATAQYEVGLISFDDWIIIEDNLAAAQKRYLAAQADMLSAEAFWIQAKGGTLTYDQE